MLHHVTKQQKPHVYRIYKFYSICWVPAGAKMKEIQRASNSPTVEPGAMAV